MHTHTHTHTARQAPIEFEGAHFLADVVVIHHKGASLVVEAEGRVYMHLTPRCLDRGLVVCVFVCACVRVNLLLCACASQTQIQTTRIHIT